MVSRWAKTQDPRPVKTVGTVNCELPSCLASSRGWAYLIANVGPNPSRAASFCGGWVHLVANVVGSKTTQPRESKEPRQRRIPDTVPRFPPPQFAPLTQNQLQHSLCRRIPANFAALPWQSPKSAHWPVDSGLCGVGRLKPVGLPDRNWPATGGPDLSGPHWPVDSFIPACTAWAG